MKLKAGMARRRSYAQTARAQATEETGQRIVAAFVARLMTQWFDEITLDCIAADASTTVQTIVRRFGGKEGLLAAAVEILAAQINAERAMPSADVGVMVSKLFADYERTGDAVIRLLAVEPRHPAIKPFADIGRREHRQWVAHVLAEPLGRLDAAAQQRVLDSLVIVTDVYTWKLLRRDMGRSVSASIATVTQLIQAVLADL